MPIKFYKSVLFRLLVGIFAVIMPVNILMIICAQLFYDAMKQQSYRESEHALSIYVEQMDQQFGKMSTDLYNISISLDYLQVLKGDISTSNKQREYTKAQISLNSDLYEAVRQNSLIDGAILYFEKKDLHMVNRNSIQIEEHIKEYIHSLFFESDGRRKEFQGKNWSLIKIEDTDYIIYMNSYMDSYYATWIKVDNLIKEFKLSGSDNEYISYLTEKSMTTYKDKLIQANSEGMYYNGNDSAQFIKTEYHLIEVMSEKTDISLVQLIPQSRVLNTIPWIARALVILSIGCLIAIPITVVILRVQVMDPIKRLLAAITAIENGDMDYRIKENRTTSEFHNINTSFNNMMERIKKLRFDVYESKLDKQRIKLEYLDHQVQPHFILNTLNIIYSYDENEYSLIQQMTMNLIRYFRYIVRVNAVFVPLRQELEHIKNYFEIQKIRYPDNFETRIFCDEVLGGCLIPPLIIQNFVENAFKNAFDIEGHVLFSIHVEAIEGNLVHIYISDTGNGFSEEVLAELKTFKETREIQDNLGVGIQNAIERLEVLYSNISTIEFYNNDQGGATVKLIIPKFFEEEML